MEMAKKLEKCEDFGCIFSLVKDSVKKSLGKSRPSMMLILQNLPEHIGALHPVGTNFIVMNKELLERVSAFRDKPTTNAYVYCVLLHEYLHALGYLGEDDVAAISYQITRHFFGEEHATTLISRYGIGIVIPHSVPPIESLIEAAMEFVSGFDTEGTDYIG